jgi:hypothetical protein
MNYEDLIKENKLLREANNNLEKILEETQEHLKKYTSPEYKMIYYENNKEKIKKKTTEYRKTHQPTEEQKKRWAKTAYQNKKAKNALLNI